MLASVTALPVIGVPVRLKNLEGMDSLPSIVQMPAGVPVATVPLTVLAMRVCWLCVFWVRAPMRLLSRFTLICGQFFRICARPRWI